MGSILSNSVLSDRHERNTKSSFETQKHANSIPSIENIMDRKSQRLGDPVRRTTKIRRAFVGKISRLEKRELERI